MIWMNIDRNSLHCAPKLLPADNLKGFNNACNKPLEPPSIQLHSQSANMKGLQLFLKCVLSKINWFKWSGV